MPITHRDKSYSSKKHPMLEVIFMKYNPSGGTSQEFINFTLKDISDAYRICGIPEPASISNTILDLTRKKGSISARLPESIYKLGHDLKKSTGRSPNGDNYAGTFVLVGVGNEIESWLHWPDPIDTITISSLGIPEKIRRILRNDEGALFSVIDYCDVFSQALYNGKHSIMRVQNPMKWQPNEIDGFYYGHIDDVDILFPVEAKALVTKDDINIEQLKGGIRTVMAKLNLPNSKVVPLAVQMVTNGMRIAVFKECKREEADYTPEVTKAVKVVFDPIIESWQKK